MASQIKVVLFEDTEETRSSVLTAMKKYLHRHGSVIPFDPGGLPASAADDARTFEARLADILTGEMYDGATFIVADQNLAKSENFKGLSVSAVAAVSKTLAIPICEYACLPGAGDYKWRRRWEDAHIVLDSADLDELGRLAALAARGFAEIAARLRRVMREGDSDSLATILAAVLGKAEYSGKIALYGVGEKRLSEVPRTIPQTEQEQEKKLTTFLGYWLWNSLLRYPGLVVNEVAAASYLNIETADFRKPQVQSVFEKALYRGPFEDPKEPRWWRGMLDDIISPTDGLELVRKKVKLKVRRSKCNVDQSKSAGYYCIISGKPVSLEESKGGPSWFPRGADLTRISTPLLDEYGPWLGA